MLAADVDVDDVVVDVGKFVGAADDVDLNFVPVMIAKKQIFSTFCHEIDFFLK